MKDLRIINILSDEDYLNLIGHIEVLVDDQWCLIRGNLIQRPDGTVIDLNLDKVTLTRVARIDEMDDVATMEVKCIVCGHTYSINVEDYRPNETYCSTKCEDEYLSVCLNCNRKYDAQSRGSTTLCEVCCKL